MPAQQPLRPKHNASACTFIGHGVTKIDRGIIDFNVVFRMELVPGIAEIRTYVKAPRRSLASRIKPQLRCDTEATDIRLKEAKHLAGCIIGEEYIGYDTLL